MYKYEEDLFHFGAKKGILGNRAGKVAPIRKSRRQGRPKPEIAPATPAATFGNCTGAPTPRRGRPPLLEIVPAHQRVDVIPSCPASLFTFRNIYFTNLLIFNTFTVKILEHAPCIGFGPGIGAD